MRGGEHTEQPSVLAGHDETAQGQVCHIHGFRQLACVLADMKFIEGVDERDTGRRAD